MWKYCITNASILSIISKNHQQVLNSNIKICNSQRILTMFPGTPMHSWMSFTIASANTLQLILLQTYITFNVHYMCNYRPLSFCFNIIFVCIFRIFTMVSLYLNITNYGCIHYVLHKGWPFYCDFRRKIHEELITLKL